jgi:poly(A) RNA polymerase GLD2
MDWRIRPLVIFIKSWANSVGINSAALQTLSSYTLTLMVLHFLQTGVQPPVLPPLEKFFPEVFESFATYTPASFASIDLKGFESRNTMSLGNELTIP